MMKKILSLLLILAFALGALASCAEPPAPAEEPDTPPVEEPEAKPDTPPGLGGYRIVYPAEASYTVRNAAKKIEKAMAALSVEATVVTDAEHDASNTDWEILVGKTNRKASKSYYKDAEKNAYTVRGAGHKFIVCGGVDLLTDMAADVFVAGYVKEANVKLLKAGKALDYTADLTVKFMENGKSDYSIVYDQNLSADLLADLKTEIQEATGLTLKSKFIPKQTSADDKYVVLGVPEEMDGVQLLRDTLSIGGWAVAISGNKIYIAGTDETSYGRAIDAFGRFLTDAENKTDAKTVTLTRGEYKRGTAYSFLKNLPHAKIYSDTIKPAGNGNQYVAIFEKTTYEVFSDWCAAFEDADYEKYATSEFHGGTEKTKNYFATYINSTYVVHLQYHSYQGRMYFIVEQRGGNYTLPEVKKTSYVAVGDAYPTILTQVGCSDIYKEETAMCYIIRVADGSFVIVDAMLNKGSNNATGQRIMEILKKQAPDPNNIVISAWFMTHAHGDHYGGFLQFANLYANSASVTLKAVYYNFPADSVLSSSDAGAQNAFLASVDEFGSSVKHVKPHTGDELWFADVKFQVMYTQIDHLAVEDQFNNYNAASLVLRMVTSDGSSVVIGSDQPVSTNLSSWTACEGAIYAWYGSFVQSDVCTTFHHGYGGGADNEVYKKINPTIVLWDQNLYRINQDNLISNAYNAWFYNNKDITTLLADDNIQILTFANEEITITAYDSIIDYRIDNALTAEDMENWRDLIS